MRKKKKLLIYAHYYIPDVASTGQLLREMAEGMLDTFDITVICVVPSYEGKVSPEYKNHPFYEECINGIKVLRIRVPEFTKSSKISRIKNIAAYFFGARKATRFLNQQEHYDFVFTISQPPFIGGLLGAYGKKHLRNNNDSNPKLIYNIQDFNVYPPKSVA